MDEGLAGTLFGSGGVRQPQIIAYYARARIGHYLQAGDRSGRGVILMLPLEGCC